MILLAPSENWLHHRIRRGHEERAPAVQNGERMSRSRGMYVPTLKTTQNPFIMDEAEFQTCSLVGQVNGSGVSVHT